jgi:hypothetical protein
MKQLLITTLLGVVALASAEIPTFLDYKSQKELKKLTDGYRNSVDSNEQPVIGILT